MGECGSAKEVVIAVQEVLERIERSIDMDEDEEANTTSPPEQLISLIHLYNSGMVSCFLASSQDLIHMSQRFPALNYARKLRPKRSDRFFLSCNQQFKPPLSN